MLMEKVMMESKEQKKKFYTKLFIAVILVLIVNIGVLLLFRHYMNDKRSKIIKDQVNSEVAKYIKIG